MTKEWSKRIMFSIFGVRYIVISLILHMDYIGEDILKVHLIYDQKIKLKVYVNMHSV